MGVSTVMAPELAPPAPKFKGESFTLGGAAYVVPGLSLGNLKNDGILDEILAWRKTGAGGVRTGLMFDVVFLAIRRNYPSFSMTTFEELEASEFDTVGKVFASVITQSFPKPKELDEGNGRAGTTTSP